MAKTVINVGTTANDGTGDQLRTAFQSTNANFDEVYTGVASVVRQTAPALVLKGETGDIAGMIATNGTDVWVCFTTWTDGVADIWVRVPNNADVTAANVAEVNDLTAAVTWANVPDANITEASVSQHKAASQAKDNSYEGTAARTLSLADANNIVDTGSGLATAITIPDNGSVAFPSGTQITIIQGGTGLVTIDITTDSLNGATGVGVATSSGQFSLITLTKISTTAWYASGDIV